ncbi:MAG: NAD(P)H-hydrate epimerase [Planctomycetota bacterium]|nr:MAG: NAD(P)H-hydrate epimerase [Planctomycetota bacterium]
MASTYLSRDEVRELDRRAISEFGMPGVVLMENAGRGAAELLRSLGVHGRIAICCGKGNNGGDGFVIARHLSNALLPVRVLLFAEPGELTGDAACNYGILAKAGADIRSFPVGKLDGAALSAELTTAEWIADALFGTGLTGPVRPPFHEIIKAINASDARVLAVDIPSGLDCDTGLATEPTVRAHHTATFAALKKGFANPAASAWLGQVHLVDIGVPRGLLESVRSR